MSRNFKNVKDRWQEIGLIQSTINLLRWDEAVKMPERGGAIRAKQLAWLSEKLSSSYSQKFLDDMLEAWQSSSQDEVSRRSLDLMIGKCRRFLATPGKLEQEIIRVQSLTEKKWRLAWDQNAFSHVADDFEKLVSLIREKANILAESGKVAPFEALAHEHDPEFSLEETSRLFDEAGQKISSGLLSPGKTGLAEKFPHPEKQQKKIVKQLVAALGLKEHSVRIDTTRHPFTESWPGDIRIGISYDKNDILSTYLATMHEAGHALYDVALFEAYGLGPCSREVGMVMHEGMALLWENAFGRSMAGARFFASMTGDEPGALHRALNQTSPGKNRLEADRLHYMLHIIMRFHIEKELIGGRLAILDLPEAWREYSQKLLNHTPESDRDGCLQDIHWYLGYFGYFPSYGLGQLLGMQLWQKFLEIRSDFFDVASLQAWLKEKVYGPSALTGPRKLLEELCQSGLDNGAFLQSCGIAGAFTKMKESP